MNDSTRLVLEKAIKQKLHEIQELMQDYLAEFDCSYVTEAQALLMLSIDSIIGNEDPTCTLIQLFAPEYPDKDIQNPEVFYNRKALAAYIKLNHDNSWQ